MYKQIDSIKLAKALLSKKKLLKRAALIALIDRQEAEARVVRIANIRASKAQPY